LKREGLEGQGVERFENAVAQGLFFVLTLPKEFLFKL
jgi:hypothetical protein